MFKYTKIPLAIVVVITVFVLGIFSFGRTPALANFVQNAWQGYKLTSGLIGYWSFDGRDVDWTQNKAFDRSTSGNNGIFTNMATATAPTVGKMGQGVTLDGTDDQVLVPSFNTSLTSATFAGWVNLASKGSYDGIVFSRGTNTSGMNLNSTGGLGYTWNSAANTYSWEGGPTIPTGMWVFVSIVIEPAVATAYVGDVAGNFSSSTNAVSHSASTLDDLKFGIDEFAARFLDGKIDDVRVYNRALSPDEIKRLYLMGASLKTNVAHRDELTSGLVGYWSFDGKDMNSDTAYDRSGSGIDGTLYSGVTKTLGKIGQALLFDGGNNAYVLLPNSAGPSVSTNGTFSAWVNTAGDPGHLQTILQEYNASAYGVRLLSGTRNLAYTNNAGTSDSGYAIPVNTWTLVTVTISNGAGVFYVDGQQIGTFSRTTQGGNYVAISWGNAGSTSFNGKIDEVRIYNRALSADEVKRLYLMGASTKMNVSHRDELTSGMAGYWTFNGKDMNLASSTKEVNDVSGNDNHGDWKEHATTTTVGMVGQGIQFDGIDDLVSIPDGISKTLDLDVGDTESLTLEGWFYRNTSGTVDVLLGKRNGTFAAQVGYEVHIATDGTLTFEVSDGTDEYALDSVTSVATGQWYHFAIAWDPNSAANTEIYINGVADGATDTGTIGNIGDLSNARVLAIGTLSDGTFPFDGRLDDIHVYKRALSPDEIKRLYLMGK
jgi:hypothetical protein